MRFRRSDPQETGRGRPGRGARLLALACASGALLSAGCTRDLKYQPLGMWNDARLKPMEATGMPDAPSTARPLPVGTIARGEPARDDPFLTGRIGNRPVTRSPVPVTPALLRRGQERFQIYCAPCHGRLGDGNGMVVRRGFPHPPDYAIRRLRDAPIGHFFDVMTNGYGVMYSYASAVPPQDRWAIANYIRVLQAVRKEVPPEQFEAERIRARQTGILDPTRGLRLPPATGETPGGGGGH